MAKPPYSNRQKGVFVVGLAVTLCGLWQLNPGLGVSAMGVVTIWAASHLR